MTKHKNNYKRFVATAATATLVATAIAPVASADVSTTAANFTDVAGNYKVPVDYLYSNKIIKGISDTQFGTARDIKRVDVAVMIANALFTKEELDNAPASGFTDVPARAAKQINILKAKEFVNGKTATNFAANSSITRGEAALMLAKAYGIEGDLGSVTFTDVADRYKVAVAALVDNDITKGKGNNRFGTTDEITRGELAVFLYKLETLELEEEEEEEVVEALEVVSIEEISETSVNVTITAAKEADEEATIEVKNGQGTVVSVKVAVIEKGDTELTFDFVQEVKATDLDGVWTVNGVEYSFTAIKQLTAIKEAAKVTVLNELNLLAALNDAGIKNVDVNRAAAYAKALNTKEAEVSSLADVQAIVDEVNNAAITDAEKLAAEIAVNEATNQTQLLAALAKFQRVNKDWIVKYEAALNVEADTEDEVLKFEDIQKIVDDVNEAEISTSLTNTLAALDSKLVTATTNLVTAYMINDAEDAEDAEDTTKANRLKALELHQAVINVNEANTNQKLSVAVAKLADLTEEADFDAETVHQSLLKDYRTAIAKKAVGEKNDVEKLNKIINSVNVEVLDETLVAINKVTADTTEAAVLALLQNQALNLEGVVADHIKDYKNKIVEVTKKDEKLTVITLKTLIETVNATQAEAAKLAAINKAQTATDMRSALIAATTSTAEGAYLNLPSQAKLEVAELVLLEDDKKYASLQNVLDAVKAAMLERTTFINAVNGEKTITGMSGVLKNKKIFPEFIKLTPNAQIDKAEEVLNTLNDLKAKDPVEGKLVLFTTIKQIKAAASL